MLVSIHIRACGVCAHALVLCAGTHTEARGRHGVFYSVTLCFMGRCLSLNRKVGWWLGHPSNFPGFTPNGAEVTGTSPATPGFSPRAGMRAQDLMLAQQAFLPPSHLSSPRVSTAFFFFFLNCSCLFWDRVSLWLTWNSICRSRRSLTHRELPASAPLVLVSKRVPHLP